MNKLFGKNIESTSFYNKVSQSWIDNDPAFENYTNNMWSYYSINNAPISDRTVGWMICLNIDNVEINTKAIPLLQETNSVVKWLIFTENAGYRILTQSDSSEIVGLYLVSLQFGFPE